MIELQRNDILALKYLFESDASKAPVLGTALSGDSPAQILVDDGVSPKACAIRCAFGGTTFYAGESQSFLNDTIMRLRETGNVSLVWLRTYGTKLHPPEGIAHTIECIWFGNRTPTCGSLPDIPEGCEIRPIDKELVGRCMSKSFLETCNPPKAFHDGSMGLALMRSDEILCEASAPWWAGGLVEVAVFTPEEHRRKGYAFVTCEHLASACENLGYGMVWVTAQDNVASVALARKLKFRSEWRFNNYLYERV